MENQIHNGIIKSRYKLKPIPLKIISMLIKQIKKDEKEYQISVKELKKLSQLKGNDIYREIKEYAYDMIKIKTYIKTDKKTSIIGWFLDIEYKNGIIEFNINPKIHPYLLKLRENFLNYEIENILSLKSRYSIKLYEFLKKIFRTNSKYGEIVEEIIKLDQLKNMLEIPKSYNYADIKRQILKRAKKELTENTDILFEYEEIKLGRKVVSVKFIIKENSNKITNYKDKNHKDEHFRNFKKFINFIREQYEGTKKYFMVSNSPYDNRVCWYSIDDKGYLYANCDNQLINFDIFESINKYKKLYKIAKNSKLYREMLKKRFDIKELYNQDIDLFFKLQKEISAILKDKK